MELLLFQNECTQLHRPCNPSLTPIYTFFTHLLQLQQNNDTSWAGNEKCLLNRFPRYPLGGYPSYHFPQGLLVQHYILKEDFTRLIARLKVLGEENPIWQQYTNLHSEIGLNVYTCENINFTKKKTNSESQR